MYVNSIAVTLSLHTYVHVHMHVCICMHVCIFVCIYVCMYVCMYVPFIKVLNMFNVLEVLNAYMSIMYHLQSL